MKIKVYENHNRVIATGHEFGKKIKVMAVCNPEDAWDEAFGKKIAEYKYKIAKKNAKIADHKRYIRNLKALIADCEATIAVQENAISMVKANRNAIKAEMDDVLASKFGTTSV